MSIIRPRVWTQQPQVPVEVDWGNSLAKTITNCLPLNGDPRDIVTGNKITLTNGTIGVDAKGKSLRGNGTQSCGSIPLNLSAYTKLTISFWLYWDTFANDDDFAMELTTNTNTTDGGIAIDPNSSAPTAGKFQFYTRITSSTYGQAFYITRPTSGAWHHYFITVDRTNASGRTWYVDGIPVTVTNEASMSSSGSSGFANSTLYLFSRANTSLFGAGRLQNLIFRGGYLGTASDAKAEYENPWQIFRPRVT